MNVIVPPGLREGKLAQGYVGKTDSIVMALYSFSRPFRRDFRAIRGRFRHGLAVTAPSGGKPLLLHNFNYRLKAGPGGPQAIFTYSNSRGLLSMPTLGGAIQLANLAGSVCGFIRLSM